MSRERVWLITGSAKGFGLEIAKAALESGAKVAAAVRSNPEELSATFRYHPNLIVIVMDVTNEEQVISAVSQAIARFGRIDVLVNNAGYGLLSGIEEASNAAVGRQYDTNVFGLLNVTRAVLPQLRKQRSGHVINISSLYGFGSVFGWGIYASTKFAVEGITEALAAETAPLGIHATAVEPGLFRAGFLDEKSYRPSAISIADYLDTVGAMRTRAGQPDGNQPGDPRKPAQAIIKLADSEHPPVHLPLGGDCVAHYRRKTSALEKEIPGRQDATYSTDYEASAVTVL